MREDTGPMRQAHDDEVATVEHRGITVRVVEGNVSEGMNLKLIPTLDMLDIDYVLSVPPDTAADLVKMHKMHTLLWAIEQMIDKGMLGHTL